MIMDKFKRWDNKDRNEVFHAYTQNCQSQVSSTAVWFSIKKKIFFCLISWDIWRIDILFHTVAANGAMCCVQSHVSDSETPWAVACQPPLSMGFSSQEYWVEWVAISFSRGSSWPTDRTCISCIAGRFFTTESHGKPSISYAHIQNWQREKENH